MTTAAIISVDETAGVIQLGWIDGIEGTPLLDLKPYIRGQRSCSYPAGSCLDGRMAGIYA